MDEIELFKSTFDIIPFGIYVVDIETYEIIYMNKHMKDYYEDFTGEKCYKSIYCEDKPCLFCKIDKLVDNISKRPNNETITFEHFNPVNDRWYQLQEKAICWPDGRTVKYSIAVDISELKETQNNLAHAHAQISLKNKELRTIASTDKLTQLNNRLKIDEILSDAINMVKLQDSNLSLIIVDIDYFKKVNDNFGHQIGDEVLADIAKILSLNTRETDFVGRWGGEEFLIVSPGINLKEAKETSEILRAKIEEHVFSKDIRLTASFGVTCFTKDDTEKSLLKRTDEALYYAKNKGRNRVEFF